MDAFDAQFPHRRPAVRTIVQSETGPPTGAAWVDSGDPGQAASGRLLRFPWLSPSRTFS